MAIYKPGSVLYGSFPYTDIPIYKRRPFVVMSAQNYQKQTDHIIGVMITTAQDSKWFGDTLISDIKPTGLQHESYVRFKFFTLPTDLVVKPLGKLSRKDYQSVLSQSLKIFGQ